MATAAPWIEKFEGRRQKSIDRCPCWGYFLNDLEAKQNEKGGVAQQRHIGSWWRLEENIFFDF